MLVEEELGRFTSTQESMLSIGVFDGVHLGHQQLLAELLKQAQKRGMTPGVVTFRHNPENLLTNQSKLLSLTDIEEKQKLLKQAGVSMVIPLSFTPELSQLSAKQFVELLQKYLKMRGIVVGEDFALGKNREGNTENLKKLGKEMGFDVTVVPPLVINGEVVSSTTIRKALADADMKKVHNLLGRSYELTGKVVTGYGRGTGLGFPTANIEVGGDRALPPDGVYTGWAHLNGNAYQAMTNIGKNPTFGENRRTIEAFLIDYKGDLYDANLKLEIVARLREEKKFESVDELKKQVAADIKEGKKLLEANAKR